MSEINLYEIIVPTQFGDATAERPRPIRTRCHKEWDKRVEKITGGLTVMAPCKGKWNYKGTSFHEKVIPVRIMCNQKQFMEIVMMTKQHYRQNAVLGYRISTEIFYICEQQKKPE